MGPRMLGVVLLASIAVAVEPAGPGYYQSFLLDSTPVWLPVDSVEDTPAAASDGGNYLLVWQARCGSSRDIHAARVALSGQVLDRDGFPVSASSGDQLLPAVVFAGHHYLIVWEDRRSGSRWDIYGARVDTAGRVLDPDGLVIRADRWNDARRPAMAAGSGRCLVVWQEFRWNWDIVGTLVDSAGNAGQAFTVSAAPDSQTEVAVAATADGFVVAWQDNRNGYPQVYCVRLDSLGTVLDTTGLQLWSDRYAQERPAASWDGTSTLVVWEEVALLDTDVYGIRLSLAGTALDSVPILVAAGPGRQRKPRAVSRAHDRLVAWEDTRDVSHGPDIYAARVLPSGLVLDPYGLLIARPPGAQEQPCAAWAGSQTIVAWSDRSGDTLFPDVVAARLSSADSLLDPEGFGVVDLHVPMFYGQQSPAAAFDGTNYLVVWTDFRNGTSESDICGTRVSPTGVVLDTSVIAISTAPGSQDSACVDSDSTGFLVVWEDRGQGNDAIYGARVSSAGVLLDTSGFAVSFRVPDQTSPSLAFNGESHLVVWSEHSPTWPVLGARVTRDGGVLDTTPILVSSSMISNRCPDVAACDSLCLVVWQTHSQTWDITGARVSHSGVVLDTSGLQGMTGFAHQYTPAVCFDGTDFLVAFQESRSSSVIDVYGTRVTEAGVVRDTYGFPISTGSLFECNPVVAFDGHSSSVVWQARGNDTWSIPGARLASSRHVVDTFTLASRLAYEPSPALVAGRDGQMLLTYVQHVDTVGGRSAGVPRIMGMFSPFGGIAEGPRAGLQPTGALPTFVRGFLRLTSCAGQDVTHGADLFDIAGRRVMELVPGLNDVRQLSPGVYCISVRTAAGRRRSAGKVVLQH